MTHHVYDAKLERRDHGPYKEDQEIYLHFTGNDGLGGSRETVIVMTADSATEMLKKLGLVRDVATMHRSHNAKLIHCAPYRVGQGQRFVLTFRGSKDCVVDMDATAIAELKEALPDVCPCCHQLAPEPAGTIYVGGAFTACQTNEIEPNVEPLPKAPPCPECEYWEPKYLFGNITCCTEYRRMRPGFSCYQPRGCTE